MIECAWNKITFFERDLLLNLLLPEMPADGKALTFELKKVEK